MFGVGLTEMIALAVLGLILIGPEQIPQVARTIGRFINDIKRSADEVKSQLNEVVQEIPKKMRQEEYTDSPVVPPQEDPKKNTEGNDF